VTVKDVLPGSAAAAAGLKAGDRLLTLDGRWTDTLVDLYTAAGYVKAGTTVAVSGRRGGKEIGLRVKPTAGLGPAGARSAPGNAGAGTPARQADERLAGAGAGEASRRGGRIRGRPATAPSRPAAPGRPASRSRWYAPTGGRTPRPRGCRR